MDKHAQYEVRVLADTIYELIKPIFPAALEAFDDYVREAKTLSRMEIDLTKKLLSSKVSPAATFSTLLLGYGSDKLLADEFGMSLRELREYAETWGLPLYDEVNVSVDAPKRKARTSST
jgi:thymidylate synthase ThyX